MNQNYYKTLNINYDADNKSIKTAFRTLAKKYHPDKNPDCKKSEEVMKQLNEAKEVLVDEQKREAYDYKIGVKKRVQDTVSHSQSSASNLNGWGMILSVIVLYLFLFLGKIAEEYADE